MPIWSKPCTALGIFKALLEISHGEMSQGSIAQKYRHKFFVIAWYILHCQSVVFHQNGILFLRKESLATFFPFVGFNLDIDRLCFIRKDCASLQF